MSSQKRWVSIIDYASIKGISISTIRRYLKSNRLKNELRNGKYYIEITDVYNTMKNESVNYTEEENIKLKKQIDNFEQELGDLKDLLNIYEKQNFANINKIQMKAQLPDLPLL